MSAEEIQLLLSYAGSFGLGGMVVGAIVYFMLKSFIPSYLSKKGENLATREDVAKITEEIERVKSQYAVVVEELRARHQLRLAAVDRRLETHQRAYKLWRELISNVHTERISDVVLECQEFWNENCLYLSVEARGAFHVAMQSALGHQNILSMRGPQKDATLVMQNWDRIVAAGDAIVRGVQLPSLGDAEFQSLAGSEAEQAVPADHPKTGAG